jgi:histidinol-phosphate aminotransferase
MKYKKFKTLNLIKRKRNPLTTRFNKIRLEKNERVSSYEKKFFSKIKSNLRSEHISAYPEVEEIYKLLAKRLSISSDKLVITAGSDLAIKNCFELLISPGDEVITLNPTYGMVDIYSELFQAKQIKISYDKNLNLDVKKILLRINKKTSLIIIANPNSPTGTILKDKDILKILKLSKKTNSYVLIDECYFGYYNKSCLKYIKNFNNLIISRSFSKIGLAGCRIGYLVASKNTAKMLYKFRPFYEITSFSCMVLKEILKNKKIFENYIRETNFILLKFSKKLIKDKIKDIFSKNNVLVLGEGKIKEGNKVLRITLGPRKYMKKVLEILSRFDSRRLAKELF